MTVATDLESQVKAIFRKQWSTREGRLVPDPEDLRLDNDAIEFERTTVLYADLSGSTDLVDSKSWGFAAEIYKTFLLCAARLVRECGGEIVSYDGDRVMGMFIGKDQTTSAGKCGLKINYAVQKILMPALIAQHPTLGYVVKQIVGIDTSSIRAARTGVRGDNDTVWVGRAANHAAKLTEIDMLERTWITEAAYNRLRDDAKFGGEPRVSMWKEYIWNAKGGVSIYGSTWTWPV